MEKRRGLQDVVGQIGVVGPGAGGRGHVTGRAETGWAAIGRSSKLPICAVKMICGFSSFAQLEKRLLADGTSMRLAPRLSGRSRRVPPDDVLDRQARHVGPHVGGDPLDFLFPVFSG